MGCIFGLKSVKAFDLYLIHTRCTCSLLWALNMNKVEKVKFTFWKGYAIVKSIHLNRGSCRYIWITDVLQTIMLIAFRASSLPWHLGNLNVNDIFQHQRVDSPIYALQMRYKSEHMKFSFKKALLNECTCAICMVVRGTTEYHFYPSFCI